MPNEFRAARLRFAYSLFRRREGWDECTPKQFGHEAALAGGRKRPYSKDTVDNWLMGRTDPGIEAITAICRLLDFDIDPAWLAFGLLSPAVGYSDGPRYPRASSQSDPFEELHAVTVPLPLIREHIAREFFVWGITLPLSALVSRQAGDIYHHGWCVQYMFGRSRTEWYLDYYASHRMTSDTHRRVWENGRVEELPSLISAYVVPSDPDEAAQVQREFYTRNQKVAQALAEKGFGLSINGVLHAGLADSRSEER